MKVTPHLHRIATGALGLALLAGTASAAVQVSKTAVKAGKVKIGRAHV